MSVRNRKEIEEVLGRCDEAAVEGTHYHGMSYEEGVADALTWVLGTTYTGRDEPESWPFEETD